MKARGLRAILSHGWKKRGELTGRLSKILAHPFIITLFASGVLAYMGNSFNNHYDLRQKQAAYLKDITDKKYKLLSESANAVDKEISLLYQMKYYRAWLTNPKNKIDDKGRSRSQVIEEYAKVWAAFNNGHNSVSTLSQVAAFFDDVNIINRAKKLMAMIDEFQETNFSEKEKNLMRTKINEISQEMYKLTEEMGNEVKKEIRKNTTL